MTIRVELTPEASQQVLEASAWWSENRPSASAPFRDELALAIELLVSAPPLTQVFDRIEEKIVRRIRLPRTRYALYFTFDDDLVTVHALWHGARGSGPPLR